jgi:hypothetical protein
MKQVFQVMEVELFFFHILGSEYGEEIAVNLSKDYGSFR